MGKMLRVFQRKANNIFIPCPLLRKQTKVKQEQGAAPGWFQALLCTRRISIKHRKAKSHHSLISFQMHYSFGYNTHTNESFLNPLLAHLHQQLICRKCPNTCPCLCPELWAYSAAISQFSFKLGQLWDTVPVGCDTPQVTSTRVCL